MNHPDGISKTLLEPFEVTGEPDLQEITTNMTGKRFPDVRITLVGSNYYHHPDTFRVCRPDGAGEYVFLHFLTPVKIKHPQGEELGYPGECLIFDPRCPQDYGGYHVGLGNDWFHFQGKDASAMLAEYGLTCNGILRPLRSEFLSQKIKVMQSVLINKEDMWEFELQLLFHGICLQLHRQLRLAEQGLLTGRKAELRREMQRLRTKMLSDFTHPWQIADLAERLQLSRSRFSALYRDFFGSSPIEDLIQSRLDHARCLLTNTTLSIKEISERCGFENIHYFSRLFHRRVGCAPRDYYVRLTEGDRTGSPLPSANKKNQER